MVLILTPEHLEQIRRHAERTYPQECCGLLMGRLAGDDRKILAEVRPVDNAWGETAAESFQDVETVENPVTTQERRFTIAPEVLIQAQREGRDRNLSIIGIYHSHPDHPATPSEFDRRCAWAEYSYIIVSVERGKAADLKNWSLDPRHQFQLEEMISCEAIGDAGDYHIYL